MTRVGPRSSPAAHPKELPPCRGPKLKAFKHHNSPIEWLGRLDGGMLAISDEGRQGYVFKVKIKSQLYALKVFKFFNPEDNRYFWEDFIAGDSPELLAELHLDPFYAECRAYGRINMARKEGQIKRDIAIPCFGFIYLDDCYRKVLDAYGVDLDEDCLRNDFSSDSTPTPMDRPRRPIRAIVKQLASSDPGISYRTISSVRKDIQDLNRLKVYNMDVRLDNFCDSKLVDFGSARTEPHCFITPSNEFMSDESRDGDMAQLEDVVDEVGLLVRWRTTKNIEYSRKLRSRAN